MTLNVICILELYFKLVFLCVIKLLVIELSDIFGINLDKIRSNDIRRVNMNNFGVIDFNDIRSDDIRHVNMNNLGVIGFDDIGRVDMNFSDMALKNYNKYYIANYS